MPPSWPSSSSRHSSSSRWSSGGSSAGRSSTETIAWRLARGRARRGRRDLRVLSVLLDGRHGPQDRAGDPARATHGRARSVDEPRQLSRGFPAPAVRALPLQQRPGRERVRALERDRVVVGSPAMNVVTLGLLSFTNMYFIEYNLVTAAAVLSVLPILIVFLIGQKWVVRGVVMSGLKG